MCGADTADWPVKAGLCRVRGREGAMNKPHCFPLIHELLPKRGAGWPVPYRHDDFSRYADAIWATNPSPSRTAAGDSHCRSDGRSWADDGALQPRWPSRGAAPGTPPSLRLIACGDGGQTPQHAPNFPHIKLWVVVTHA